MTIIRPEASDTEKGVVLITIDRGATQEVIRQEGQALFTLAMEFARAMSVAFGDIVIEGNPAMRPVIESFTQQVDEEYRR